VLDLVVEKLCLDLVFLLVSAIYAGNLEIDFMVHLSPTSCQAPSIQFVDTVPPLSSLTNLSSSR
jgi:hypothetical protein